MSVLVTSISAGGSRSVALRSDSTVAEWGAVNIGGEVGFPGGLTGVTDVSTGWAHAIALKSDGTVVGWGDNGSGQAVPPTGLTDVAAISAGGSFSLALKLDGSVIGWGNNSVGQAAPPAELPELTAIAAGWNHSLGITTTGTLEGWGDDGGFENYIPPVGLTDVIAVATNRWHSMALKSDGTVVAWGDDYAGKSTPPTGLVDVVAISCGFDHSLALKSDGTVVAWGDNSFGQLSPPAGLADVVAISCGEQFCLALQANGTVVGWGDDSSGQSSPPQSIQPVFDPIIDATLSFSAELSGAITYKATINSPLTFQAGLSGYQDWVSSLPPLQLKEVYGLVITGSADSLPDLSIDGISSWQATSQAGDRSSFLQVIIPAATDLVTDIEARQNGDLVLLKGYRLSDGTARYEELMRSSFDTIRSDRGPRAFTLTVSGYLSGQQSSNGSRALTGIRSISVSSGKRRVRCDIDMFLRPGMTVAAAGTSFEASYINYNASQSDRFCEVGER
jgi:hypothetical protein